MRGWALRVAGDVAHPTVAVAGAGVAGSSADGGIALARLLPLVDHICVSAGEREAEVIEALRAAGAEDPEAVALFRRGDTIVSAAAQ